MKSLKKLDVVIIVSLLFLSFTPNIVFSKSVSKNNTSTYASIKVDGKLYDNISLSSFKGEKTFTIKTDHGSNTISIKNNTIKVIESDCKDEICVNQGTISSIDKNIVCLTNRLIIEIKGDEEDSSYEDMILSH